MSAIRFLFIACALALVPQPGAAQGTAGGPGQAAVLAAGMPLSALPPRPADAPGGQALAERLATLAPAAREALVADEILRGNVPESLRRFVPVDLEAGGRRASVFVAPDYLGVGAEGDFLLTPLSPRTALRIAKALGCTLPTRRIVDAIHRAAPLKLEPAPIPPSPAMTTMAVFAAHNATVAAQRAAAAGSHPPGVLVAGHKKDIVRTPRLASAPGKVAIYGWHRPDGRPIQPLHLGHTEAWVDYSHGARLVRLDMLVDGAPATVDAVLADPVLCALLSDEGPIRPE